MADDDLLVGRAREGSRAGEQLVGDDAQAVQVGALVERTLRREVGGCSKEGRGPGDAREVEPLGDPEVGQLGHTVGADQDVGRL